VTNRKSGPCPTRGYGGSPQTWANSLGKLGAKTKGAVPALVKRVADDRYAWDYSPGPLHWNKPPDIQGVDKDAALAALKALAPEKVEQALLARISHSILSETNFSAGGPPPVHE
jgi:hypothetical protein